MCVWMHFSKEQNWEAKRKRNCMQRWSLTILLNKQHSLKGKVIIHGISIRILISPQLA